MARLKKSIVILLPVFWLVTLSYVSFESTASARPIACTAVSCPFGDATPESGDPCYLFNDQVRHTIRRLLLERTQEKPSHPGLLAGNRPSAPPAFLAPISLAGGAWMLQQRWQFVWRTADSPRAPCLHA